MMSRRGSLYQPCHFPAIGFNRRAAACQGETNREGTTVAAAQTAASALCSLLDVLSCQVPADAAQRVAEEPAEQFGLTRSGICGGVGAIAAVSVWDWAWAHQSLHREGDKNQTNVHWVEKWKAWLVLPWALCNECHRGKEQDCHNWERKPFPHSFSTSPHG